MIAYRPVTASKIWKSPRLGSPDIVKEFAARLPEFKEPLNFFIVSGAWVAGDLVGHELFDVTAGAKTGPNYYRNKLLLAPVWLLVGRILSDVIGGPPLARAASIATIANLLMQVRYIRTYPADFNVAVFLIHEILLVPLSLLIVGKRPGEVLFFKEGA